MPNQALFMTENFHALSPLVFRGGMSAEESGTMQFMDAGSRIRKLHYSVLPVIGGALKVFFSCFFSFFWSFVTIYKLLLRSL